MFSLPWPVPPNFTPSFSPKQRSKCQGFLQSLGAQMLFDLCFWCRNPEYSKVMVLLSKASTMSCASKPHPEAHTGLSSPSYLSLKYPKYPCKEHETNPDLTCMPSRRGLWITRSNSFHPCHHRFLRPCCAWTFWRAFHCPFCPPKRRTLNPWPHPQSTQSGQRAGSEVELFLGVN